MTEKDIPIGKYDFPNQRGLDSIIFKPYKDSKTSIPVPESYTFYQLWQAAGLFYNKLNPRHNWNSFMQHISNRSYLPKWILRCCQSLI